MGLEKRKVCSVELIQQRRIVAVAVSQSPFKSEGSSLSHIVIFIKIASQIWRILRAINATLFPILVLRETFKSVV